MSFVFSFFFFLDHKLTAFRIDTYDIHVLILNIFVHANDTHQGRTYFQIEEKQNIKFKCEDFVRYFSHKTDMVNGERMEVLQLLLWNYLINFCCADMSCTWKIYNLNRIVNRGTLV